MSLDVLGILGVFGSAAVMLGLSVLAYLAGRRSARPASRPLDAEHRVIFDAAPTFIWYKDRRNRILRINSPAATALGRRVEEIEGRPTAEFYPEEAAKYHADDLEVIESGVPKLGIVELIAMPSGEKRWVRTDKIPYRDTRGNIIGVIVFSADITDQKIAEQHLQAAKSAAEQANRAKSDFLANVSHEVRTPLGAMMGFSELLASDYVDAQKRRDYAGKILRNGERLKRLIDELLDLSRVEQGHMHIESVPFSFAALIADLTSLLGQKARAKNLKFHVVHLDPVPPVIISDPLRLRQILVNVGANAIKFTDAGAVTLELSHRRQPRPELDFVIRDTGRGIAADRVGLLFQPFYQADPMDARQYGGTGLGLALSRRLARELGGDLVLDQTEPGVGSSFRLTVGFGEAPGATLPAADTKAATPVVAAPGKCHILLAEDNPDIQEMVGYFLSGQATRVSLAVDGRQAVEMALHDKPDLVLMDLQLPEPTGLDATRELRRRGFDRPIVAMTAHAMTGQRQLCLDAGFTDFLAKPVSRQELLLHIRTSLAARPPQQA